MKASSGAMSRLGLRDFRQDPHCHERRHIEGLAKVMVKFSVEDESSCQRSNPRATPIDAARTPELSVSEQIELETSLVHEN